MRVLGGLEVVSAEEAREAELRAEASEATSAEEPQIEAVEPGEQREEKTIEETILAMETSLEDAPVIVPVENVEVDEPSESPSPDSTQVISRQVLEAAIGDPGLQGQAAEPLDGVPSPDSTQVIPREVIEAAVAGEESDETAPDAAPADLDLDEEDEPESSTLKLVRNAVDDALQFQDNGGGLPISGHEQDSAITGEAQATLQIDDDWECPEGVDRAIARFNAVQRVVYRTVRAEVGAGAINFIRSCCSQLFEDDADALEGVDLQADGSWDTDGLRNAIRQLRLEDPSTLYQKLIDHEIDQLRQFIGDAKVVELRKQVEQVEQADAAI